ncbi:MAG: hypothetical protein ACR2F5_05075 [Candidatus Limnocylindria bacterium]
MATPKPGEIRCPTCHRSTPPAGFCTQCGSAIPVDARIRPRGLDRDELQDRIRARRSGGEPFRRGGASGAEAAGYERFAPEPEDEAARHSTSDAPRPDLLGEMPPHAPRRPAAPVPFDAGSGRDDQRHAPDRRPDLTREDDERVAPAADSAAQDAYARPVEPAPYLASVEDYREPDARDTSQADYDEAGYAEDYEYTDWQEEPRGRRSAGAGALAILGFLALGVLALLGGAVLAGVFSDDPQTGQADTSPTAVVSSSPLPSASAAATPEPSASEGTAPSEEPRASGGPIEFADGFVAEVQPCLPGSADVDGCDSNGAISGGALDIWVGFTKGNRQDVISAEIIRPDGTTVSGGTIDLADIGCGDVCNGWTRFSIERGLQPGTYDILVTRNGTPAGESSFVVS